ncbi:MAG TPA: serine/threonine-protein kinase [Gaiellaceae bacterium]|nr:serine/threonine-protein kinase [Gaiellaceae bacterium]
MSVQALAGGRYRVERELGHGGMSTVFLAHDEELDRPVAVKVLAAHLASQPGLYERFVREARMAAKLSHPNVVQVFDAGEEDDRPYIVMEYVPGRTVADELSSSGKLEVARVVDLALQVCGGLELAHSSGLVHRDVKPQNLLVRDDGTVKIADFGIARAVEATNLTQIGSILGTAAYLSPEQAEGETVTAAADIYSLGVVLYELLTGRTPHEFSSLADLVVKQREQAIRPLTDLEPSVPPELEAVVMRCLARNPDYRPSSAAELARELAAASPEPPTVALPRTSGVRATEVATAPLGTPPPAPTTTADRPRRARRDFALPRRGFLALVLVGVLVAAVVAFAVWPSGGEPEPAQDQPPTVEPVPQAGDPGEQARNLADWLRENSR